MTAENSAAESVSDEMNSKEKDGLEYPPDTAKYLGWQAIEFIKAPTSKMLDITALALCGTFVVSLILCHFLEIDVSVRGAAEVGADGGVKEIVSPVDGQLVKVFKKIGDRVEAGELVALLEMDGATPEDIQTAVKSIDGLIKKVEVETSPIDLKFESLTLPTEKIYNPIVLQSLVNVEHAVRDFQAAQTRNLALLNKGTDGAGSEVSYANRRITFLAKRIKKMKASKHRDLLALYIDAAEEEMGRLKTQVTATQTKSSDVLELGFADLLKSLRIASGVLDDYKQHHELRAPISGTIGKIVEGENVHLILNRSVATIIPSGSKFIAHIKMKSKDLVRLKKGQRVYYKVEAYPYQRYGLFTGEIIDFDQVKETAPSSPLAAGAVTAVDDTFILNATIEPPDHLTEDLKNRIKFIVGMSAEATVIMGRKSINEIMADKFLNTKDNW